MIWHAALEQNEALCAWLANSSGAVVANEPNVARCKVASNCLTNRGLF